uniref:centromere-associated protein E n=1 Tax=Pristiophorus japonicus TaxID=55135 RepID=UPI00398F5893
MSEEDAVQVCVRLRPLNDRENALQGGSAAEALRIHWKADNRMISQIAGAKSFSFDRVFHAEETSQMVYHEVAHSLVLSITQGYNGTIFAYGQTSSGKTYTMMGNANAPGLIPLAIRNLFKAINDMSDNREFLMRVSYMEIYNESVSDLLAGPKGRPLEVREDMERTIYVADLTEELVVTYDDVMKWVMKGEKNRHYGETKMNEHSSRSHTIFRVIVESRDKNNEAVIVAHLNLVDLAGSERTSQTGAEGVRLKEGCNINRSLFVLGQVIKKLSDGQAGGFLNYRDSKLTRILQNSLGGNAKTLIICTITPVVFEETLSTLQFASTAKFMKNTPHVNEVLEDQAMLKRCRKEIMDLKSRAEELTSETRVHAMEKAQLLSEKQSLQLEYEQKIKNLTRMLVRVSPDEDQQEFRARRKRRVTWAPGKLQASLDCAKIKKLDKPFLELDDDDDDNYGDGDWRSETISECSNAITVRRGGSWGLQIPSFEDSLHFSDQITSNQNCTTSMLDDVFSKDELEKRIYELEKQLESLRKEKEKESREQKNRENHFEKQLQESVELCELLHSEKFDTESLKIECDKQKEEIKELKELLKESLKNAEYLKMENKKQKNEITELEKLSEGIEDLKERREIEMFEFLEKETEKEEKTELKTQTKRLKEQEQNLLALQQLKELSDGKVNLEMLMVQIKQLQQSLCDTEVVTRDAKKESAFLRSENMELKEETNEMRIRYQQMEKDIHLYRSQLDTERSRYKQMQSDLQNELKSTFNENNKLISLLDGKVPKDLLDSVRLEKNIADLKQQLDKAEKEKTSLQQEADLLSPYKSLPEKVDELTKQVLKLTEELNGVTSERDRLLVDREEQLENLRGEMSAIVQDRNKLQEVLVSLQSERDLQENLKTEQEKEMQCRVENHKKELDLHCTQFEEEKAKCVQLQHDLEDKERRVQELEQQLMQEQEKQKGMDLLDSVRLEKNIADLKQQLDKAEKEKTSLQQEADLLSPYKSLPEKVDELTKQVLKLTEELNGVTSERDRLLVDREEQLENLRGEMSAIVQDRNKLQEVLVSLQSERDLQENLKTEQEKEMQCRVENHKKEFDLHCTQLEKEKAKCVQLQHDIEDKERRVQELEQQLMQEQEKQKGMDDKYSEASENLKLLNEVKDELLIKLQVLTKTNEELTMSQPKSHQKAVVCEVGYTFCDQKEEPLNVSITAETTNQELETKDLTEQLLLLQKNCESLSNEKEELHQELISHRSEMEQLKCDLQDNIEMCIENQAELRQLHDKLKQNQNAEMELKKSLAEKEHLVNEEKEKIVQAKEKLQQTHEKLMQQEKMVYQLKIEIQDKNDLISSLQGRCSQIQDGKTLEQAEEFHCMESEHHLLLSEMEKLRAHVSKEQCTGIREEEFKQRLQQFENEKLSIVKERDDLQVTLESVKVQRDEMKSTLQGNTEMMQERTEELHRVVSQHDMLLIEIEELRGRVSKEQSPEILEEKLNQRLRQLEDEKSSVVKEKGELQAILETVNIQLDEMKSTLQENTEMMQEQTEECHRVVSQRDLLLSEIEELRARVSEEQSMEILEGKFNQRLQQVEDEKLAMVKEKEELQEILESVNVQMDEMKSTLQENTEMIQEQTEELHRVVSRHDMLLIEIEELRGRVFKEQSMEILEEKLNQRLQQLEDEKSSVVKKKEELQAILESVNIQLDEMKSTLQENTEMMQEQTEECHRVVSQRDLLLSEIEELRARVSEEQSMEILEGKFNQRLQQVEDEKLAMVKEKEELQEILESVNVQMDEMKSTLQENTEMMQEQTEERHRVMSQRDLLLSEIEELRARVSKEQSTEILEGKYNQRLQQLEDEKSAVVKDKDDIQEIMQSVQVQRDEMKSTLQENTEMLLKWTDELNNVKTHRDQLLIEIEQLKEEIKTHVSKVQKMEQESNDQLERTKLSTVMEKDELKLQMDKIQNGLSEKVEMLVTEERRNKELAEFATTLENQIITLKEEQAQNQSTNSETDAIEAEIQRLSNHLQEKDLLLQDTIQSLFQLESEYNIELAKADQELSREREAWKELLARFCSEESTESTSIGKLQEENQTLHEKLALYRSKFMNALSSVFHHVKNYQNLITKCDIGLAEEKKKNEDLLVQFQTLKKQVSDPPELELTSEEKNSEITRLSTLIENKENHLQNTLQTLSELKSKYQNFLTSTESGLHSKTKARKYLMERISNESCANVLKAIEYENQMLNQEFQLQQNATQSEFAFNKSIWTGYAKYIRNSCEEVANEKKKNEELLLQIESLRQHSFNKNGCDLLLAVENQKLSRKLKTNEQLLQKMRIKINELEMALTASQEIYKQQEDKVLELQTELSSKSSENKLDDLQTKLLKKDSQIKQFKETLEQLQAKVEMGAQPFKEEITELKNRLFVLEMGKIKDIKHLENQMSSLKASLEHKEELLRKMKETLRRNQQEQDTTIMVENKDETCSTDASLTYSAGSGIVQNALLLVLNSEKATLNRDLNRLKKENACLTRTVSELKYENNKWKERAAKLKEKERVSAEHQVTRENVQHTSTLNPEEGLTSLSQKERAPMPQKVEISTELLPSESKTAATRDEISFASGKMIPIDLPETSSFGMESQLWSLPRSKIFDDSQLGFVEAGSPQPKPKSGEKDQDDWCSKPSADDPQCKMQ